MTYAIFFSSYLFQDYSCIIGGGVNMVWVLIMVIGASSAYFHATLSLVGQLLDEVAILWVLLAGYALWTPKWMIQSTGIFKTRLEFTLNFPVFAIKLKAMKSTSAVSITDFHKLSPKQLKLCHGAELIKCFGSTAIPNPLTLLNVMEK